MKKSLASLVLMFFVLNFGMLNFTQALEFVFFLQEAPIKDLERSGLNYRLLEEDKSSQEDEAVDEMDGCGLSNDGCSDLAEVNTLNMQDSICWICTDWYTSSGHWDSGCQNALGLACAIIGTLTLQKWLAATCYLGILVACYVPPYTICTSGFWSTTCPTQ